MSRPTPLGPLALVLFAACSGPPGAGLLRGKNDLGSFDIAAVEQSNNCGAGALGSLPNWEFSVELSEEAGQLYWDERTATPLVNSEFHLTVAVDVAVAPASRAGSVAVAGCTITRTDTISGLLETTPEGATTLEGGLVYSYTAANGASCGPLTTGLERLPCEMSYELKGVQSRAPQPLP